MKRAPSQNPAIPGLILTIVLAQAGWPRIQRPACALVDRSTRKPRCGPTSPHAGKLAGIEWQSNYSEAQKTATSKHLPLLLYFHAAWCGPCHQLERGALSDPVVVATVKKWIAVKVDLDDQPDLAAQFGVTNPPEIALVSPSGVQLKRIRGMVSPRDLAHELNLAAKTGARS